MLAFLKIFSTIDSMPMRKDEMSSKVFNVIKILMRSFGLMIFLGLFLLLYILRIFLTKNEFSSNIQGNISGGTALHKPIHLFILLNCYN